MKRIQVIRHPSAAVLARRDVDGAGLLESCRIYPRSNKSWTWAALKAAIESGKCKTAMDDGGTLLHEVAGKGSAAQVLAVIRVCDDLDKLDKEGRSALYIAVEARNLAAARVLIEHGANPGFYDDGDDVAHPMFAAVLNNHLAMAKLLVNAGATLDVEFPDVSVSPLHIAVAGGSRAMAKLLAENGGMADNNWDVDLRYPIPINLARDRRMADILLNAGATRYLDRPDLGDWLPLEYAASEGKTDVVRAILWHGMKQKRRRGCTRKVLSNALWWARHEKHRACVEVLLRAGAKDAPEPEE